MYVRSLMLQLAARSSCAYAHALQNLNLWACMHGTLGARGDANLRDVVRNYVRPVTWLDAPADKSR